MIAPGLTLLLTLLISSGCGSTSGPKLTGATPRALKDAKQVSAQLTTRYAHDGIRSVDCAPELARHISHCAVTLQKNRLACDLTHSHPMSAASLDCSSEAHYKASRAATVQIMERAAAALSGDSSGNFGNTMWTLAGPQGWQVTCLAGRRTTGNSIMRDAVFTMFAGDPNSGSVLWSQAVVTEAGAIEIRQGFSGSPPAEYAVYSSCKGALDGTVSLTGPRFWGVSTSADEALTAGGQTTPAPPAAATPALVLQLFNNGGVAVRPGTVASISGDGTEVLGGLDGKAPGDWGRLTWSAWTNIEAKGSGAIWLNDCLPDCASGAFTAYPVTVHASEPEHGYFTRLALAYTKGDERFLERLVLQRPRYSHAPPYEWSISSITTAPTRPSGQQSGTMTPSRLGFTHPISFYDAYFEHLSPPGFHFPGYSSVVCAFDSSRKIISCEAHIAFPGGFVLYIVRRASAGASHVDWAFTDSAYRQRVGIERHFSVPLS
jgi:hypothetical protein